MKSYRIKAELLAPLVIRQNRQSNASQGVSYLPGSTFRGALAAKYLRMKGGPEDEKFRILFLDHPVCFPNLLPTDKHGNTLSQVLPLTSVSCKRNPGFKGDDMHGVSDILAAKVIERKYPGDYDEALCPKCDNDMKSYTGFWNGDCDNPKKFQPTMFYQRHTGIDRDTGTIAPSIFFITQAMADFHKDQKSGDYLQQFLSGNIFLSNDQYEILNDLIDGHLFVGADRTRGMGELHVEIVDASPDFDIEGWDRDFEGWDRDFKDKLKDIVQDNALAQKLMSGCYFSIKLESDAILTDRFLRPTSEFELPFYNITQVLKVAKSQTIRGWNSAWGLPKPDDLAIVMGSVYLFKYNGNDLDNLKKNLNDLIIKGVGLRREEGFGRISVCDSLHVIKKDKEVI
ncbi:MAG: CRISPR-associated RAMP protein Csx10 [Desulfobacterales bacterium]|nr:CRISPR-associated RAMP protein Csx10 [Desulfobacterales bacterium]